MRTKAVRGFQTGDMVRAEVPNGKKAGVHLGRVAVRARSFRVGNADGTNATYCKILHRADGYGYGWRPPRFLPALNGGVSSVEDSDERTARQLLPRSPQQSGNLAGKNLTPLRAAASLKVTCTHGPLKE
jgi:hypothetical protein